MYPHVFLANKIEENDRVYMTEKKYRDRNQGRGRRTVRDIDLLRDTSIRKEDAIKQVLNGTAIIKEHILEWIDTNTHRKQHTLDELMDYRNWRIKKQKNNKPFDPRNMRGFIN